MMRMVYKIPARNLNNDLEEEKKNFSGRKLDLG
jgi:hypothetical protein